MKHLNLKLMLLLLLQFGIVNAQNQKVKGVVKDASGEPLIGVNVLLKGGTVGAITDLDGAFDLIVNDDKSVLVFSFVGFETKEVPVKGRNFLTVTLMEDNTQLEEVVVVGYGTQKRQEITGSVASVSRKEIMTVSTANITSALQGKIPGLNIKQNTGEPGTYDNSFNIRGLGAPMVIVDGIPRDNFDRIDPNEIESVSVLKDATAAVYGVRAANGVILVTTRKGTKGRTEINLNASYGIQGITKYPKSVDAYGYMELYNEAMANRGEKTPTYSPDLITSGTPYANVNWYDEIIRKNVPQYQVNLTASGGTDRIQFFNSIGYYSEEGLWKSKSLDYERFNLRSNITAQITDQLTAEFQVGGFIDTKNAPPYDPADILKAIGAQVPIYEIYANGNPNYLGDQYNNDNNALVKSSNEYSGYRKTNNTQIQVTASLRWDIPFVKGLWAKALVAYDPKFHKSKLLRKQWHTYSYDKENDIYKVKETSAVSSVTEWRNDSATPTTQLSLNYENKFLNKHNVKALVLFETRKWETSELSGVRNTLMDAVDHIYAGLIDDAREVNSMADRNANVGLVGRLDYDYLSKYLLQASFRYDGSSKFYNKKWGFFPSLSLGWRISEENFFKDNISFVDNLKLRASIGRMGDDNVEPYLWMMAFDYPGNDRYLLGDGSLIPGVGMPQVPNVNATWYTSTTKNLGIDLSLWNAALTVEFDLFRRDRDGLLANRIVSVPGTFGATFAKENINSDLQQGFELVLGHNGKVRELSYQVQGNFTYTLNRNKYVESTPSGNSYDNWRNNRNNRNSNILWMYQSNGQFISMDEIYSSPVLGGLYKQYSYLPGDIKYVDYNEDGMIDEWDKQPLMRNNTPIMNFGLTLNGQWKGLDLSMSFQGAAMFNARMNASPLQWGGSAWDIFMDRWHKVDASGNVDPFDPDGKWVPGKYPSTRVQDPQNYGIESSFWYNNCSYLRLKNLEIGYTFPNKWTKFLGVNTLRLYANGYNLFTIQSSDSDYIDPENPGGGIDRYPIMRNFNFGINVNF
ncbi:SusC/RagA family TonB-linked outer membrane protein [Bacteroides salyersiae]|uniref:SusC/RagA family TonB-linked outer membrane protein n=1 Tax=Bacteroides salyersiae TaxID=291644 RepID=UPI001898C96F|nr:TonB-dependent receptor [Bacteroides salyersiae]